MSLMEKIRQDQIQARKNRDAEKASLLTTLLGEASMKGKNDGNRESTDAEVEETIRKFLKGVRENLKLALERNDHEWINTVKVEQSILEAYLPKQMTADEIREKLSGVEKTKPAMMKYLKANFAGLYDGATASKVVDELLMDK